MTDKNTQNGETIPDETIEAQAQSEVQGELPMPTYDELQQMLEQSQAKAEEYWNQALRVQADAENSRRRAERDVENAHKYALEKFVNELLPVKDSLELGEAAARAEGADLDKVREGLELTMKMLATAVAKFGVVELNPLGEKFSAERHQAMAMQDAPDAAPNTVIAVYQKGYLLNDRLVRPAMVVVASAKSGANLKANAESAGTIDFQA
jgi:molecular chaperone GrpE